jgi:hypothetical protein
MRTGDDVICHGDAKPHDRCFADIVATDDSGLIAYIAHRRRWRVWYRLRALFGRLMEGARTAAELGGDRIEPSEPETSIAAAVDCARTNLGRSHNSGFYGVISSAPCLKSLHLLPAICERNFSTASTKTAIK